MIKLPKSEVGRRDMVLLNALAAVFPNGEEGTCSAELGLGARARRPEIGWSGARLRGWSMKA